MAPRDDDTESKMIILVDEVWYPFDRDVRHIDCPLGDKRRVGTVTLLETYRQAKEIASKGQEPPPESTEHAIYERALNFSQFALCGRKTSCNKRDCPSYNFMD